MHASYVFLFQHKSRAIKLVYAPSCQVEGQVKLESLFLAIRNDKISTKYFNFRFATQAKI